MTPALSLLAAALLAQDGLGAALREFDSRFKEASKPERLSILEALARHDRAPAAERIVKSFQVVEEAVDTLLPERAQLLKEGRQLPELRSPAPGQLPDMSYFQAVQAWQAHWGKERELGRKIQDLIEVRGAAVRALGGFRAKESILALLRRLRTGTDAEREGIGEAAAAIDHGEIDGALTERVAKDKSWRVRVVAIDSLAKREARESLDTIARALRDPVWQVQMAAVAALERFGDLAAVPALIDALKGADGRLQEEIRAALVKLTGVDKGTSAAAWAAWWGAHGEDVKAGLYRPSPEDRPEARARLTRFYGIPVTSKRVVLAIDRSGSMLEESGWKPEGEIETGSAGEPSDRPEGTRKIDVAKFELRRVIRTIPEDTLFTIVSFSEGMQAWKETLVVASKRNKEDALAWVHALEATGGTNTYGALQAAFEVKGPPDDKRREQGADTIFFMTDGRPSVGEVTEPDEILSRVADWNRTRKVKINTVAVGLDTLPQSPGGGGVDPEFLRRLAEMTGGFHVWRK
jgi:Mg-chelatase subunit ChlD